MIKELTIKKSISFAVIDFGEHPQKSTGLFTQEHP